MKRLSVTLLIWLALASAALAQAWGPIPQVSITTNIPTYATTDGNIANTGAGDIFCLSNTSATRYLYINEIHTNGTATAALVVNVNVIKRSTAASGGTPVAESIIPFSNNNPATVATAVGYTVSPTPGTAIGTIMSHKVAIGVQGNTASISDAEFLFGNKADQAIRIGNGHSLCVNVAAAGAGASWAVYMKWTEQ